MLEAIARFFAEVHFQYTEQFLTALLPMTLTVICHGFGMGLVRSYFKRFGSSASLRSVHRTTLLVVIVAIMLATHYIEITIWAWFYFATDMIQNFKTAMYFSVESYTTLGASNITLPERWQGLEGFEALTAMLMFGWSTAMLVAVVHKVHSIEN
ncbi:MAG: ion channel [Burkholderiales bacterium]